MSRRFNQRSNYFLYRLNQEQLSKSCFPLYKYNKNQVRKLANEINIEIAKKKDSVGICFVGKENLVHLSIIILKKSQEF